MRYLVLIAFALVILYLADLNQNEALDLYGRQATLYDGGNKRTYNLSPLSMLGGKGMTLGGIHTEIPLDGMSDKETLASIYLVGSDFRVRAMEGIIRGTRQSGRMFVLKRDSRFEDESLWNLDRLEFIRADGQLMANMVFCRGSIVPEAVQKEEERQAMERMKEKSWMTHAGM